MVSHLPVLHALARPPSFANPSRACRVSRGRRRGPCGPERGARQLHRVCRRPSVGPCAALPAREPRGYRRARCEGQGICATPSILLPRPPPLFPEHVWRVGTVPFFSFFFANSPVPLRRPLSLSIRSAPSSLLSKLRSTSSLWSSAFLKPTGLPPRCPGAACTRRPTREFHPPSNNSSASSLVSSYTMTPPWCAVPPRPTWPSL